MPLEEEGVTMNELKPCPFCGAKETDTNKAGWPQLYIYKSTYDCFVVNCRACGVSTFPKDTERAARIAWNRRDQDGNKQ